MHRRSAIFIAGLALCVISRRAAEAAPPNAGMDAPGELDSSATPPVPPADPRAVQVQAAEANAMAALRDSVLGMEVGRGFRIRELVDRTGSGEVITNALSAARQFGGPRWVDEQTCQVQVSVPGSIVAEAVLAMAGRYPGRLPVRTADLNAQVARWRTQTYSAAGSSVAGGGHVQEARPAQPGDRWATVSPATRSQAIGAAQTDAVRQVVDALARAVGPMPCTPAAPRPAPAAAGAFASPAAPPVTVGSAMARPAVAEAIRAYLAKQPVTKIEFNNDLTVAVSITVDGRNLADLVQRSVSADQPALAAGTHGVHSWPAVRAAVEQAVPAVVTGVASAVPVTPSPGLTGVTIGRTNLPAVVLPIQPPAAFGGRLDAEGSAAPPPATPGRRPGGPLRVRAAADADAVAKLRAQLLALRVTDTATLADAARADPQLSAAVSRVMLGVQDDQVDRAADGSVHVRAHLDLQHAWDLLRAGQ